MITPSGKIRPETSSDSGTKYIIRFWIIRCCGSVVGPERFIICRVEMYVVAHMMITSTAATTLTTQPEPDGAPICSTTWDGVLNAAAIGATPNSFACAALLYASGVHPYRLLSTWVLVGLIRRSTWNSDRKTGAWSSSGRQPISGLT